MDFRFAFKLEIKFGIYCKEDPNQVGRVYAAKQFKMNIKL